MSDQNKKQTVEEWLAAGNKIKTEPTKTTLEIIAELKPKYAALMKRLHLHNGAVKKAEAYGTYNPERPALRFSEDTII